jgi:hypothetical protein
VPLIWTRLEYHRVVASWPTWTRRCPKCLTIISAMTFCCAGEPIATGVESVCGYDAATTALNEAVGRVGPNSVHAQCISNDRTTGRSEASKAVSAMARTTSSNFSMVTNVLPLPYWGSNSRLGVAAGREQRALQDTHHEQSSV